MCIRDSNWLSRLGALILTPAFHRLKQKIDYDEYGGALLLGLTGVCVKAHGRSKAKAVKNAIRKAFDGVEQGIVKSLTDVAWSISEKSEPVSENR